MKDFGTVTEFEQWLERKGLFHMELGLGRMSRALASLPALEAPVVQVLGTNGKGSTCAFLDRICREHGLKTGLYTSPHFLSVRERILVNGREPCDALWLEGANIIRQLDDSLTYFEYLTLMAVHIFHASACDVVILEAGLGGANDATSAVPAAMHCFTPVAMDHAHIIGPGPGEIAKDKAAAIQPGRPVISAPQYNPARDILLRECSQKSSRIAFTEAIRQSCSMNGQIQEINAAVAAAAWHELAVRLNIAPDPEKISRGLAKAFIPGRRQFIGASREHGAIILDGGHNPHAIQALVKQLPGPGAVIFSALADKDWGPGLAMLCRLGCPILIPQLDNPRAAQADELAAFAENITPGRVRAFADLEAALAASLEFSPTLITGSLYLLAAFYSLFPQYLHKDLR